MIGVSADRLRDRDEALKAMRNVSYPAGMLSEAKVNGFGMPEVLPIRRLSLLLFFVVSTVALVGVADDRYAHWAETREQLKRELGDKYSQPIPPGNEEQISRGMGLYDQLCAGCHGSQGDGTGAIAASLPQAPSSTGTSTFTAHRWICRRPTLPFATNMGVRFV
jgi:hypothetical protein